MIHISDDDFDAAVEEALASVPPRFQQALDNIAIVTAKEPTAAQLSEAHTHGGELLGLYQGVPLPRRTTAYAGVLPDKITIFQEPHERVCNTREQLVDQIRVTVLHELGHYFGFDDAYLHSHGY
ncbi:putative Zn metallo-peptidase [Bifidobacterium magnum]|uniref:Putative Zn metallo-peptidase n=1 Tax=Bifidobacterium magnum TaxID=1692 RepID=A0A087BCU1_9BIFI|nr:putative Zn metallo-peptidase [Bifidobacterium magnum]